MARGHQRQPILAPRVAPLTTEEAGAVREVLRRDWRLEEERLVLEQRVLRAERSLRRVLLRFGAELLAGSALTVTGHLTGLLGATLLGGFVIGAAAAWLAFGTHRNTRALITQARAAGAVPLRPRLGDLPLQALAGGAALYHVAVVVVASGLR